jgi:glycine/D-amino acid oxidase-like deaminating enzyme
LHAAELGVEVTLIERGRVGGTAFNSGRHLCARWLGPRAW